MCDDGSLSKLAIQFFEEEASKVPDVQITNGRIRGY